MTEAVLMLYVSALGLCDLKRRSVPLALIAAGALAGLILDAWLIVKGALKPDVWLRYYLCGTIWGLMLLGVSRLSGEAVGKGDALCFISFSMYLTGGEVLTLLLEALTLCSLWGTAAILIKGRSRKMRLPFLPFVWAARLAADLIALLPRALR